MICFRMSDVLSLSVSTSQQAKPLEAISGV